MKLYIAEKPDVAKAICTALGGGFVNKDGYFCTLLRAIRLLGALDIC